MKKHQTRIDTMISVQTIGMKNILLSKKIIQEFDWSVIKNSIAIPFTDQ